MAALLGAETPDSQMRKRKLDVVAGAAAVVAETLLDPAALAAQEPYPVEGAAAAEHRGVQTVLAQAAQARRPVHGS